MMKDGENKKLKKKESLKDQTEQQQQQDAKSLLPKSENNEEKIDYNIPTSLNEDLDELLDKDVKRFFGGCGG